MGAVFKCLCVAGYEVSFVFDDGRFKSPEDQARRVVEECVGGCDEVFFKCLCVDVNEEAVKVLKKYIDLSELARGG